MFYYLKESRFFLANDDVIDAWATYLELKTFSLEMLLVVEGYVGHFE